MAPVTAGGARRAIGSLEGIRLLYAQISALILATSLVQLANGFFTTVVSLRLATEDFGSAIDGLIMSAFFIGFTIGSLTCGRIIRRIGHIRGYAAFGAIVIFATQGISLWAEPLLWILLRGAIGFGCVGIFVATESWLNAKAEPASRGRIFATYMVGTFVALALGQLLVGRMALDTAFPFGIIVALFAAALVIVAMTRAEQPAIGQEPDMPLADLGRGAPVAIAGAGVAGMISATVYAVTPAWMLASGIDQGTIGQVMLAVVLGGLAFQIPVGRLSDRSDRRMLLSLLAVGFAAAAIALIVLPRSLALVLPVAACLGGFMATFYPVAVSHAMDRMVGRSVVSVNGRLILVSGIGSVIGPFLGTWIMGRLDLDGVLYLLAGAALLLASMTIARSYIRPRPRRRTEAPFVLVPPQPLHVVPKEMAEAKPV